MEKRQGTPEWCWFQTLIVSKTTPSQKFGIARCKLQFLATERYLALALRAHRAYQEALASLRAERLSRRIRPASGRDTAHALRAVRRSARRDGPPPGDQRSPGARPCGDVSCVHSREAALAVLELPPAQDSTVPAPGKFLTACSLNWYSARQLLRQNRRGGRCRLCCQAAWSLLRGGQARDDDSLQPRRPGQFRSLLRSVEGE